MFKPLPNRSYGYVQDAIIGGHRLHLHARAYENGALGEIDIRIGEEGSPDHRLFQNYARAVSIGLQNEAPLRQIYSVMRGTSFEPSGFVEDEGLTDKRKRIPSAQSFLDYVGRRLMRDFEDYDTHIVKPRGEPDGAKRVWKFKLAGQELFLHAMAYKDGSLGKIEVDIEKTDKNSFFVVLNSFGRIVSLGLQYGAPLKAYVGSSIDLEIGASNISSFNQRNPTTLSSIDYIFRELTIEYLQPAQAEKTQETKAETPSAPHKGGNVSSLAARPKPPTPRG